MRLPTEDYTEVVYMAWHHSVGLLPWTASSLRKDTVYELETAYNIPWKKLKKTYLIRILKVECRPLSKTKTEKK